MLSAGTWRAESLRYDKTKKMLTVAILALVALLALPGGEAQAQTAWPSNVPPDMQWIRLRIKQDSHYRGVRVDTKTWKGEREWGSYNNLNLYISENNGASARAVPTGDQVILINPQTPEVIFYGNIYYFVCRWNHNDKPALVSALNTNIARDKNWKVFFRKGSHNEELQGTSTLSCDAVSLPAEGDRSVITLDIPSGQQIEFKITQNATNNLWIQTTNDENYTVYSLEENVQKVIRVTAQHNKVKIIGRKGLIHQLLFSSQNKISAVSFQNCESITQMDLLGTSIATLDMTRLTGMKAINLSQNAKLSSINFTSNTNLYYLNLDGCVKLPNTLDLSKNGVLRELMVSGINLKNITFHANVDLRNFWANRNDLQSDVVNRLKSFKSLESVQICENKGISKLDLSGLAKLREVLAVGCALTSVDVHNCPKLQNLYIGENASFSSIYPNGTFMLDGCHSIKKLGIHKTGIRWQDCSALFCKLPNNQHGVIEFVNGNEDKQRVARSSTKIATDKGWSVREYENGSWKPYATNETYGCGALAPTATTPKVELGLNNGETKVKVKAASNNTLLWVEIENGQYDIMEVGTSPKEISLKRDLMFSAKIYGSITELEITGQDKVKYVAISDHASLQKLTLTTLSKLERVSAHNGRALAQIKVSGNTTLKTLELSNHTALTELDCHGNALTAVNVRGLKALKTLNCSANNITELDLLATPAIEKLECNGNSNLANIYVGNIQNVSLKEVNCEKTRLGVDGLNALFCNLPGVIGGKLIAANNADEDPNGKALNAKNCWPKRAIDKGWSLYYGNAAGTAVTQFGEKDPDGGCPLVPMTDFTVNDVEVDHNGFAEITVTNIVPANAGDKRFSYTITSGEEFIKLVENTVLGKKVGKAKVTVASVGTPSISKEITVTVKEVPADKVEVTAPESMLIGREYEVSAVVLRNDGTTPSYTEVAWSVDPIAAGSFRVDNETGKAYFFAKAIYSRVKIKAEQKEGANKKSGEKQSKIEGQQINGITVVPGSTVSVAENSPIDLLCVFDPIDAVWNGEDPVATGTPGTVTATVQAEKDANGFLVTPFKVTVRAVMAGKTGTVKIKVAGKETTVTVNTVAKAVSPTSIELSSNLLSLVVDQSHQLVATVVPAENTNGLVLWESSDPSVASVDALGRVTAHKLGTTNVTAKLHANSELSAVCGVAVRDEAPSMDETDLPSIAVSKSSNGIALSFRAAIDGTFYVKEADNRFLRYTLKAGDAVSYGNENQAAVTLYGPASEFTCVEAALENVEFSNDCSALTKLDLHGNRIVRIDLSRVVGLTHLNLSGNSFASGEVGIDLLTKLERCDLSGTQLTRLNVRENAALTWLSCHSNAFSSYAYNALFCGLGSLGKTGAQAVVALNADDNAEQLSGANGGLATGWQLTYVDGSAVVTNGTDDCPLVAPTSIALEDVKVGLNRSLALRVKVKPTGAYLPQLEWTSNSPTDVKVENGTVTGLTASATAEISAKSSDGLLSAKCTVTVGEEIRVTSIALTPAKGTVVVDGEPLQFVAKVEPEDASYQKVTWQVEDVSKASVTEEGEVSGVAEGVTKLIAKAQGSATDVQAEAELTILAKGASIPVESIEISGNLEMEIGETQKLLVNVLPINATNRNYQLTSSAEGIVKVDGVNIEAVSAGTAEITATSEASPNIKHSVTVTVKGEQYSITFSQPSNGKLEVKMGENPITSGSSVGLNTEITVVATPDAGYKLSKLTIGDTEYKESPQSVKVTKDLSISAHFEADEAEPAPSAVESDQLAGVTVGPNPTEGQVQVRGAERVARYAVLNATGQVFMSLPHSGESCVTIDLGALPSGMYLLRLEAADGSGKTLRVVKQ